ncbi:MAG: PAS domain-containing sensor histidine kinase, partial [Nitrospinaceae bacterium]|nr:PAS domain-containing sensor histidine kinase [Nitrospinaceae bacterium]NIR57457.1 PAS domain-containing sensor histidine kinase [Nitrospinaceae bacterium]NIS87924.1 PAS domain-containing sensor histidine kinase [Nitrospinaceae bacterium]NIT84792.1 PAS domain-containing sensor histidine kinase [Nitrospinaceae bacterium]NIU46968.1 PAS domain-containing sensor histidine kinase [Nitrospinaceae bacterium]
EIRNPLGSIELFASLLARDLEADPDKAPLVEHIRSGVKTMDRIISSLLLFAKSPKPSRQKCDINRLLRELLEGSSGIAVPDNVKVTQHFGGGDLQVNGDRELLRQVLLNLLRNAIQAMPEGGELGLRTEKGTVSPTQENHREFITITVSDTGSGIPSDHLSNIFNPFFSTKDKGTGLGLSIAYNIIKAHQGTIDAESEESRGTRFTVNLPRWDDELDET